MSAIIENPRGNMMKIYHLEIGLTQILIICIIYICSFSAQPLSLKDYSSSIMDISEKLPSGSEISKRESPSSQRNYLYWTVSNNNYCFISSQNSHVLYELIHTYKSSVWIVNSKDNDYHESSLNGWWIFILIIQNYSFKNS